MIYAVKKQNESNERLISRFKKLVQRSRIIMDTKQSKYHARDTRKRIVRKAAIKRDNYRKVRQKEQFYSA